LLHGTVGDEICQRGRSGWSVSSSESSLFDNESSLWPAISIGKSLVLNYLMNSSEQTQLSTVGTSVFCASL